MYTLLILLTFFDGTNGFNKISKENTLKQQAEVAYKEGRYPDAITSLKILVDELSMHDEVAVLNLGHAYLGNKDLENASKLYEKALLATDKKIKSVAAQQLGILSLQGDNDKEKALAFFKEALRANPNNTDARHNYELLKKGKEQDPENKDKDKNKDDKNKDSKNKDKKDQNKDDKGKGDKDDKNKDGKGDKKEDNKDGKDGKDRKDGKGDKKDEKENKDKNGSDKEGGKKDKDEQTKGDKDKKGDKGQSKEDANEAKQDDNGQAQKEKQGGKKNKEKMVVNPEALAQMGMTEQKAKALLNAMRSNETQYIQQVKREPSKKSKKGKPDW